MVKGADPMIDPTGQQRPYAGNATATFDASVISAKTEWIVLSEVESLNAVFHFTGVVNSRNVAC